MIYKFSAIKQCWVSLTAHLNVPSWPVQKKLIMVGSCRTLSRIPLLKLLIEKVGQVGGILAVSDRDFDRQMKPLRRCGRGWVLQKVLSDSCTFTFLIFSDLPCDASSLLSKMWFPCGVVIQTSWSRVARMIRASMLWPRWFNLCILERYVPDFASWKMGFNEIILFYAQTLLPVIIWISMSDGMIK